MRNVFSTFAELRILEGPMEHIDTALTPNEQGEYQLLKLLADHYNGSMLVTDNKGRFLYVNDGCCSLLGMDRETLLKISIYDTLHDTATPPALRPSRRWRPIGNA